MKKKYLKIIIIVVSTILLSFVTVQYFLIKRTADLSKEHFEYLVNTTLKKVAERMKYIEDERNKKLESRISIEGEPITISSSDKSKTTYEISSSSLESTKKLCNVTAINIEDIAFFLRQEFRPIGISYDFELCIKTEIKKCVGSTPNFHKGLTKKTKIYSTQLFADQGPNCPNLLEVYFVNYNIYPKRELILSSSLSILLLISFIFILYILLHQKKLSIIKNDFINNMTHEFKTPISTISLASQMLKDASISNAMSKKNFIGDIISEECARLSSQVEKILQMATFEQGKERLKYKEININEIILKVINSAGINITKQNGTISADLKYRDGIIVADELHLTNVLHNLIDNAEKYCDKTPEITLTTERIKEQVRITVRDNGIGISKDNQRKIFDQFFRVHTGNVHNIKGFGLGLNYVKKIIFGHNGTIKVNSTLKKGSEFIILLPIKQ